MCQIGSTKGEIEALFGMVRVSGTKWNEHSSLFFSNHSVHRPYSIYKGKEMFDEIGEKDYII